MNADPILTMFAALAKLHAGNPSAEAFDVVRDVLEMELIDQEVMLSVIIGKKSLADVLRQGAEEQIDQCSGCGADVEKDAAYLAAMMVKAAAVLDGLGEVCPG